MAVLLREALTHRGGVFEKFRVTIVERWAGAFGHRRGS